MPSYVIPFFREKSKKSTKYGEEKKNLILIKNEKLIINTHTHKLTFDLLSMSAEPETPATPSTTVTEENGKKEDAPIPAESAEGKSTNDKKEEEEEDATSTPAAAATEEKTSPESNEECKCKCANKKLTVEVLDNGRVFKLSGKEDYENHTCYEGHEFELTSFTKFTYCNYCKNILMGVSSQGYMCKTCCLCFHEKCLRKIFSPIDQYFESLKDKKSETSKTTTTTSGSGSDDDKEKEEEEEEEEEMEDPEEIITPAEKELTEKFMLCKLSACFNPNGQRCHQWVEGNTYLSFNTRDTSCIKCKKSAGSLVSFTDYRCLWCGRLIHSSCMRSDPEFAVGPCSRGPFKPLLIDPNCIAYNDVTGKWIVLQNNNNNNNNYYYYNYSTFFCIFNVCLFFVNLMFACLLFYYFYLFAFFKGHSIT